MNTIDNQYGFSSKEELFPGVWVYRNVIKKDISTHKVLTPIEVTKYLTDKSKFEELQKFNNK